MSKKQHNEGEDRINLLEKQVVQLQSQVEFLASMWSASLEAQIADLQNKVDGTNTKYRTLFDMAFKTMPNSKFVEYLRTIDDYNIYFELLPQIASRFLVILTVKDTPGDFMPKAVLKAIIDSKFSGFRTDLWRTYVGIVAKNKVICDKYGQGEQKSSYTHNSMSGDLSIVASSEPWRNGNKTEIIINGNNYALNNRGVNMVVYCLDGKKVLDRVSFDSHVKGQYLFKRG